MSGREEESEAPEKTHAGILTISDTRAASMEEGRDEDESGKIIERRLEEEGIPSDREIIFDERDEIREEMEDLISDPDIDVIITTGGTGITSRDITIEVIRNFFDKEITGFGEALRREGYEMVGVLGLLTRATAGLAGQKPVFCLPGTPNSIEVGMDLILEELPTIVNHARK